MADFWSLGIITYDMISGEAPFDAEVGGPVDVMLRSAALCSVHAGHAVHIVARPNKVSR